MLALLKTFFFHYKKNFDTKFLAICDPIKYISIHFLTLKFLNLNSDALVDSPLVTEQNNGKLNSDVIYTLYKLY